MANFNPPFSTLADKRVPTSDERQNGFPCGPADQQLFNGMFHRIEAEIGAVIDQAGITQTDERHTLLREAIEALINAATGGGDPAQYLLINQARARLPIYPDVQNVDGRIVPTMPVAGTIRLPGGVNFLHRGIFPVTTAQTDFATTASKIYHLRWTPADGFQLKDLADPVYNPGGLAETDVSFDTGYDNMLIARVVTNSGNVATITALRNNDRILTEITNNGEITNNSGGNIATRTATFSWNLSRRPIMAVNYTQVSSGHSGYLNDFDQLIRRETFNRYGASIHLMYDLAARVDLIAQVIA